MRSKSIKSYLIKTFSISSAIVFAIIFILTGALVGTRLLDMKSTAIFNTLGAASDNLMAQIDAMYASA